MHLVELRAHLARLFDSIDRSSDLMDAYRTISSQNSRYNGSLGMRVARGLIANAKIAFHLETCVDASFHAGDIKAEDRRRLCASIASCSAYLTSMAEEFRVHEPTNDFALPDWHAGCSELDTERLLSPEL